MKSFDRRGTGLNTIDPGDAKDAPTLVEDVNCVRQEYSRPGLPMHIAGFCWGATYAICCAEKFPSAFYSIILIAPSIFPAPDIAKKHVAVGNSSQATEEPLIPIDRFTRGPAFKNYIIPDKLRTRAVSPRFNSVMIKMTSMIAPRWVRLALPNLMILANNDRVVDNQKHEQAFEVLRTNPKQKVIIDGEHGLQFDAPVETADAITAWMKSFDIGAEEH